MTTPTPPRLRVSRAPHPQLHLASVTNSLFERLTVPIDQLYSLRSVLGRGANATVYFGIDRATNKQVAVKVVRTAGMTASQNEDLRREVRILSSVTHANVVHLMRTYEDATSCYLVQELSVVEVLTLRASLSTCWSSVLLIRVVFQRRREFELESLTRTRPQSCLTVWSARFQSLQRSTLKHTLSPPTTWLPSKLSVASIRMLGWRES